MPQSFWSNTTMNIALSRRERLSNSIVCTAVPAFKTGEVVLFFDDSFVGKEWIKEIFFIQISNSYFITWFELNHHVLPIIGLSGAYQ
jgi:hypothetical protein